jgi:hypothetical protein
MEAGRVSVGALLDRLDGVKQTGHGRWLARCPAHEDRSPSLSIRELDDGRILLHDFGGCGTDDVLAALGLEMAALFPARLPGTGPARSYAATHSKIAARDLLELVSFEMSVAAILIDGIVRSTTVDAAIWKRLAQAAARIGAARDHAHG